MPFRGLLNGLLIATSDCRDVENGISIYVFPGKEREFKEIGLFSFFILSTLRVFLFSGHPEHCATQKKDAENRGRSERDLFAIMQFFHGHCEKKPSRTFYIIINLAMRVKLLNGL